MAQELFTKSDLAEVAADIRARAKNVTLLFAYNGVGKTRLSMEFKELGKSQGPADTLYFNAFTQDLFWWNNDLPGDTERHLWLNGESRFTEGLKDMDMNARLRPLLERYATFYADVNFAEKRVNFSRDVVVDGNAQRLDFIKVSRGEENIFYWCFFLAVLELAIQGDEAYTWVKYVYVDDPTSSLDDNNTIAIAHHLAVLLKSDDNQVVNENPNDKKVVYKVKAVISTHHALYYNVMCNEFGNGRKLYLRQKGDEYELKTTHDTPFIYHISMIQELQKVIDADKLMTYHFSTLRTILEKAANFHGYKGFDQCITLDDDADGQLLTRMTNLLNHGGYSLFEPAPMGEENKKYFKQIFDNYKKNYKFNREIFEEPVATPLA
jgi:hypothetical protein